MKPPRSNLFRVIVVVVLLLVFVTPAIRIYDSGPDLVVLFLFLFLTARWVSYRRRDALMALIPFYNLFLVARFGWRLAFLPYRDWPPRADERHRWEQIQHPTSPGALLYIVR